MGTLLKRQIPLLCIAFLLSGLSLTGIAQKPVKDSKTNAKDIARFMMFHLKNAKAESTVMTIEQLLASEKSAGPVKIVAVARTNSLIVTAPDQSMKKISDLIEALDSPRTPEKQNDQVKIFALMHSDAVEIADVLPRLIGPETRIVADARSNSVIATGTAADLAVLEAMIQRLDDEKPATAVDVQALPLRFLSPEKAMKIVRQLGMDGNVAVDAKGNRLLVQSDLANIKRLESAVKLIDVPEGGPRPKHIQLRIVWLVDEKIAKPGADAPAGNLEKVVQTLDQKLGLKNLKMAAQMLVTINQDGASEQDIFNVKGTAELAGGPTAELSVAGALQAKSDGSSKIDLELTATEAAVAGKKTREELVSLATVITAPPGHSVVLGASSIRSASSVFVLQVLAADKP